MKHVMLWVLAGMAVLACPGAEMMYGQTPESHPAFTQGSPLKKVSSLGKDIYEVKCKQCHGENGRGDGRAAWLLFPKPRDFTAGVYKFRTTESGSIPTDEDLIASVKSGLHGTSMPAWDSYMNEDSVFAVVQFIKGFSQRFVKETPQLVFPGTPVPSTPASLVSGERVYDKLQCASCHGMDGRGANSVATDFEDDWGNPIAAADLTKPWTFKGGSTPRDIYLRFRTGIDGTPMPSYIGSASEREMWDLANYVLSLQRLPVWAMNAEQVTEFYARQEDKARKDPVHWGKYLVKSLGCAECHTPLNVDGSGIPEMRLAGGQLWKIGPYGDFVSYNLTSDKETGLGGWTDDQIRTFLTTGVRRDGSRMLPFPMPWPAYANMKDADLAAVIAYLRTIPPVYNKIPLPESRNIFSYLWGKFEMLILKEPFTGFTYSGNAGSPKEKPVASAAVSSQKGGRQ